VPVGGSTVVGDLTVRVQACVERAPGEAPDSAIYVVVMPAPGAGGADGSGADVASSAPDGTQAIYRGWLVKSEPGAAVVGDAAEAFRVIGCS
jgi:hypothetical protein